MSGAPASVESLEPGWGANYVWFHHQSSDTLKSYLQRTEDADITYAFTTFWTRVDAQGYYTPELRPRLKLLREAGQEPVVIITHPPAGGGSRLTTQENAFLQDDLLAVFQASKRLGYDLRDYARIYFGANEPDLSWISDLPDRVTAHHKALYLGLKAGAASTGPYLTRNRGYRPSDRDAAAVLMPGLGTGVGPWLEEAAANGLFSYQDALNLHYYGWEPSFGDFVDSMRAVYSAHRADDATLPVDPPVWVTEINTLHLQGDIPTDPLFRREQARYIALTANTAVDKKVAVYIPYALKGSSESNFDLLFSAETPYPAWQSFAKVSRDLKLNPPDGRAIKAPQQVHPVVMQWLPAPRSVWPSKANAAYRFVPEDETRLPGVASPATATKLAGAPGTLTWQPEFAHERGLIYGELRAYNFSEKPVSGFVRWSFAGSHAALMGQPVIDDAFQVLDQPYPFDTTGQSSMVEIGPLSVVRLPLAFRREAGPLLEGEFRAEFITLAGGPEPVVERQRHQVIAAPNPVLAFSVETLPEADELAAIPVAVVDEPLPLRYTGEPSNGTIWPVPRNFTDDRFAQARDLTELRDHPLPPRQRTETLRLRPHVEGPEGQLDFFNTAFPFGYEVTSRSGIWHGMNGVDVVALEDDGLGDIALQLELTRGKIDASRSRVAVAMVDGMPGEGAFRLRSAEEWNKRFDLRLILIDRFGTMWTSIDSEPLPNAPNERWYRWEDFRPMYFGNLRPGATLQAEDVVSLHLSFRTLSIGRAVKVGISFFEDPNY
ncbi:MAG: hypothetical protein Q7P63_11880 [Verrucomicrobiota bacterium JB022]|nr:hypothetical protein [Verrucomicrobiota bacterium JB022]